MLDLLDANNKLEVVGVYTWASEEDSIGNGVAADTVANLFEDALNATVAAGSLPSDPSLILDLVLNNMLGALGLIGNQLLNISIPGLGDVGDDVLGGGLYIGIGAKGTLATIIDGATVNTPPITFEIPVVNIVPDITGGGFFTMGGPKNFTQTFTGDGGQHTYQFSVSRN